MKSDFKEALSPKHSPQPSRSQSADELNQSLRFAVGRRSDDDEEEKGEPRRKETARFKRVSES